ncbi:protein-disulfide reductase DsbD domain-containing protein [Sphingomonas immobilis]|uniref:Protein-disulfide reductase DsbD family protein n=1 Tax=Sphingomonas immobilis TaxID=3063997 RepID=A0ABT9A039_9SPHN|nr:protein-disulfide reductase DsbD domain-containing protein [Sphingomonas sp. CA1-15]MDO7843196.1 protein-disulfide reductase DsbD family protein [Sphingomonas sp. CA1-15]
MRIKERRSSWFAGLGLAALALQGPASAQGPAGDTVSWTATASPAKAGGRVSITLTGTVRAGWHVYALKQLQSGPTPLRVTLDANDVAEVAGAPTGSKPVVAHDPAFGFDTPYYTGNFSITIPAKLNAKAAGGRQSVPVSVRFQTCNGATCQPPRTVKIAAPVQIGAGT